LGAVTQFSPLHNGAGATMTLNRCRRSRQFNIP